MASNYTYQRSQPYVPGQTAIYKLSRSKIELFTQCPRCFWLDVRLKITRPSSPPFQINKAIDELFKKEFDGYRKKGEPHPIMVGNDIKAVPFAHKDLDTWRHNFTGVQHVHEPTNLHIFGAIDDVWVSESGELIVVDYKATAKDKEVSLDADWQQSYKRQMEIYQWLLRRNGFEVQSTGYFVYTNGRMDVDDFQDTLHFRTKVIAHTGNDDWVEQTIIDMKACMDGDIPAVGVSIMGGPCEFCTYAKQRTTLTLEALQNASSKKA